MEVGKKVSFDGTLLDITQPEHVEVRLKEDYSVLWINVDDVCVLRICRIGYGVIIHDGQKETEYIT